MFSTVNRKICAVIITGLIIFGISPAYGNVTVQESADGITMIINGIKPQIVINDGKNSLTVPEWQSSGSAGSGLYDKFQFSFAVPNSSGKVSYNILSTKVFEYYTDNIFGLDNKPILKLAPYQTVRGIKVSDLMLVPYWYDNDKKCVIYADSLTVNIKFDEPLLLTPNLVLGKEEIFFSDIQNKLQLKTFIDLRNLNKHGKSVPYLNESSWYDKNIDYVKIETKEDALTKFAIKDITTYLPDLVGKNSKYLHLLHRGKEYPYIILNDDGLLSGDDEVCFYGLRPVGDTTWLDNYTNFEPFYVYYSESSEGLRIAPMENIDISSLPVTNSVTINQHIEKEIVYGIGSLFMSHYFDGSIEKSDYNDSRTVPGEGWYWDRISPRGTNLDFTNTEFNHKILLAPSDEPNDRLNVSLKYRTNQDSISNDKNKPFVLTYYDLRYLINGDLKKRDSITGYQYRSVEWDVSGDSYIQGLNKITLKAFQVYVEANMTTNIDFIEVKGKSKPIAYQDRLNFNGNSSNMRINARGFNSAKILAYDKSKNIFKEFTGNTKGTLFRLGGKLGDSVSASIGICDSVYYSDKAGIYVLVYNFSNNTYTYKYFSGMDNTHSSYINSILDGSAVAILVLSPTNLNADFSSIRNLGSKEIDNFSAGSVFAGSFIKSGQMLIEKIGTGNSGFTEFFAHSNGISNSFDIALQSETNSEFVLAGVDNIETVAGISPVNKSNLTIEERTDVVFISHKNFISQAERLAEYRRQTLGLKVEVIDAEDIYKEYNFGKKSPHAIKEFLKFAYEKRDLSHVMLFGDASWDARKVMNNSISTDWIPTYGYPASDWWYACLEDENDLKPEIILGRLPANYISQAQIYVDKAIEYENTPELPWMKNFLFLTAGYDSSETYRWASLIKTYYRDNILKPELCGTYNSILKDYNGASSSTQGGEIRAAINQGALWTIYIGHAAAEILAMDGWGVGKLNNKGRYGILSTVSCNVGAFAEPHLIASRLEEYILEQDKGFVAATGASFTGFINQHNNITSRMISALADTNKKMRFIGDLMFYGKMNISVEDPLDRITLYTYTLFGDPLVRVRVGTEPDAYINENEVSVTNQSGINKYTDKDESVIIKGKIYNYGYCFRDNLEVRVIRNYFTQSDTILTNYAQLCMSDEFSFPLAIKDMAGSHKITIEIDPEGKISELNKNNNKLVLFIDVFKEGLLSLDPQAFWNFRTVNPIFRLINPFQDDYEFDYQFILNRSSDTNDVLYYGDNYVSPGDITISDNYVDWHPVISIAPGSYWLHTRYFNKTNSTWSIWTGIPVNAQAGFDQSKVKASISNKKEFETGRIENLMVGSDDLKTKLYMRRDSLDFKSVSIRGNRIDNEEGNPVVDARANIEAGGKVFVDGPFELGFNVVTIKSRNGELISRTKRFETWGLHIPYPAELNLDLDTMSYQLVEYLRDSIADDEYLIIATCQSSFRMPLLHKLYGEPGDPGSIDSVLFYLRQFGSRIADTLTIDSANNGEQISFTMMGWRGAEIGSILEKISFVGDSAAISGNLITFSDYGKFESSLISKAKKWNHISVEGSYTDNGTKVDLILYGINSSSGGLDTILVSEYPNEIDLSTIDSKLYPELKTAIVFEQKKYDINTLITNPESFVSSINFDFIPADELAIVKNETTFDKTSLMRGENVNLHSIIENLSLRNDVDSAIVRINVSRSGTDNDYRYLTLKDLKSNSSSEINHEIITDFLDYNNTISINIDPDSKISEFYRFNNDVSKQLQINRDSIKPSIVLKIDDNYHKYGDYISILPMFEVELFDNSPLQITDSTFITVRINGYLHPYQRTIWSEFKTINDGTNLKAVFRFRPDTLQYDDATIIVYVSDNEGNKDTLTTLAYLSLVNANAKEVYSYPNPAMDDVKFNLVYTAPLSGMNAKLEIFDLSGNKIDAVEQTLKIGTNTLYWNGRYNGTESLPAGIYVYRIRFSGDYYLEPVFGKFVIMK